MKHTLLFAAMTIGLVGCGGSDLPELGTVSGKVTLNGDPLPKAIVNFTPMGEGRPSTGETNEAGEYSLQYLQDEPGAIVGQHKVTVDLVMDVEMDNLPEDSPEAQQMQLPPEATDGSITKEVKADDNQINIELGSS